MIGIVVPTVAGRERSYRRTMLGYETHTVVAHRVYPVFGKDSCGEAWNDGVTKAIDDGCEVIHLTADDIVPHPGWDEAALRALKYNFIPAPRVLSPSVPHQASFGHNGDGQLMPLTTAPGTVCRTSVIPVFKAQDWEGCIPIHYYSDDYVSWQLRQKGWSIVTWEEYTFTHWFESGGARPDMYARIQADRQQFFMAINGAGE